MNALVLAGGGAKGAYQMGAWRAFREKGIEFDIVTGTSIGALNGAMYVQGDYDKAYQLWRRLRVDSIINVEKEHVKELANLKLSSDSFREKVEALLFVIGNRGLDVSPMKNLMRAYVHEDKIRASKIKFGMVTVSLSDFRPLQLSIDDIPYGELHDYLMASANLPIFDNHWEDGKRYIDGGIFDNRPVSLAKKLGGTAFTLVDLNDKMTRQRLSSIPRETIKPKVDLGGVLELEEIKIMDNIRRGYLDTLKHYGDYNGQNYYFTDKHLSNLDSLVTMLKIERDDIVKLKHFYRQDDMDDFRFINEVLIKDLAMSLKLDKTASYSMIYDTMLETLARIHNVDDLVLYTRDSLLEALKKSYQPGNTLGDNQRIYRQPSGRLIDFQTEEHIKQFNTIFEMINKPELNNERINDDLYRNL